MSHCCCIMCLTFQALFEPIQLSSVGDCGHSVMPTVLVLLSVKGRCKGVELDTDISLSVSFGCQYSWFNLPTAISFELVVKHPCCPSTFDVLPVNTVRQVELPGKPKLFLPKSFPPTDQPNFLWTAEQKEYFWSGLM